MSKHIVFFNLADKHKDGLAKTSVESLRLKYPRYRCIYELFAGTNRVDLIDLFGLLEGDTEPKSGIPQIPLDMLSGHSSMLPAIDREKLAIRMLCGTADKIMLGVHGRYDDTERGFAGMGWGEGTGTVGRVEQFANLIADFLRPGRTYKIALIVCFGARSANFAVDHDGDLLETDIKSSFAYKFYKEICTRVDVTMTARTGSVSFDRYSGRSLVQTEAAVRAEINNAEIQAADITDRVAREYKELQSQMMSTEEGFDEFSRIQDAMLEPSAAPNTPEERIVKAYFDIQGRVNDLTRTSSESVPKHGKFVYRYRDGVVNVYRKYEAGRTVMRLLYSGPL